LKVAPAVAAAAAVMTRSDGGECQYE